MSFPPLAREHRKSHYFRYQFENTFFGMFGSGVAAVFVLLTALRFARGGALADPRVHHIFAIASCLVLVQVLESAFVNLLRSEQRTADLMKNQVTKKYLSLALMAGTVLFLSRTVEGFYSAQVIAETATFAILVRLFLSNKERIRPSFKEFSRPLYAEMLRVGIPMMIGYELGNITLAIGDRYVIQAMLGEAQLGLYGAAYNLCQYVQALVLASIGQAITPISMQMYDREGPEATSAFLGKSLRTYALFGAPIIAGLAAVGGELLPSLASDKYTSASAVLPWVIAGMVVEGTGSIIGAGLFIQRRTRTLMAIVLGCALLNIGLNVVLVPHIGIVGSAIATLVAYSVDVLALRLTSNGILPVEIPWATIARAGLLSVAMYFALAWIYPGHVVPMMLIDPDGRAIVRKVIGKLSGKLRRG